MMKTLNEKDFDSLISSHEGFVLVDFFADWCGPCRTLSPLLESLSESYPEVPFVKVDTEKSKRLGAAFGVRSLPTVVLLKTSEEGGADVVSVSVGVKPESYWRKLLDDAQRPKRGILQRLFGGSD